MYATISIDEFRCSLRPMKRLTVLANCCPPLGSALADDEALRLERVFRALGDRHRVKIVGLLASAEGGPACVCELVPALGLAQPTVSYHLKQLLEVGLLEREKRGTFAYYRLAEGALDALRSLLPAPAPLAQAV